MSVLSYLQERASDAVLSKDEKESIQRSIATLASRLSAYFGNGVQNYFQFGSSTRGTILPRFMDPNSDIDYMVVFTDSDHKPDTYLARLRRFVENRYSTSEIHRSHPSIVLELNHIRFELVPAINPWLLGGLRIPAPAKDFMEWMDTDPSGFSGRLEAKNKEHGYLIKSAIRLAKFWNARNGGVFSSYLFEAWIADLSFWWHSNLNDYLLTIFENLVPYGHAQWRVDKIERAQQIIANVRKYERDGMPATAEAEIKKLIPEA